MYNRIHGLERVGLGVNITKTKDMKLARQQIQQMSNTNIDRRHFNIVKEFVHLGTVPIKRNEIRKEIAALDKLFRQKTLSR